MTRETEKITLPVFSAGTTRHLLIHRWGKGLNGKAYIQASLHADEIPGLLVAHHLIRLLEEADIQGQITGEIVVVPFANPIGLNQHVFDMHMGRHFLETGENFNRAWPDLAAGVSGRVASSLTDNAQTNVALIRDAIRAEIAALTPLREDEALKKSLLAEAADSDIVLDLHCDSDSVMHLYLGSPLWPDARDIAAELGSHVQLLAEVSGGNPFDEACGGIWWALANRYPDHPIPPACLSATVELRGESDVADEYAAKDASALFRILQRRGFISGDPGPLPQLLQDATPLDGVDTIEAEAPGVFACRVKAGDVVEKGALLGEIVPLDDPTAERIPVITRTAGVVYGMRRHRFVRPGQVIIKIAGPEPLAWRKGDLLNV